MQVYSVGPYTLKIFVDLQIILNNLCLFGFAHRLNPDSLFINAKIIWAGTSYVSELFLACLYQRYFSEKILHALLGYLGTELHDVKKISPIK